MRAFHILALTLVALLFSAVPAAAAPITGLISLLLTPSLGALTIGGVALGSTLGQLLTSVALSALSQALAPKPKASGIRTKTTLAGGINPEAFLIGQYATSGARVCPPLSHGQVGKTPNAYLTYVVELAGIPGHTLDGMILGGQSVDILTADPHADYGQRIGGDFLDRAWIKYYDGTQTTADSMLLAKYPAPHIRPWTADMVGEGMCYAVLTLRYDREVFQAWPQPRFVVGGVPLYDPRLDTTAGGSGPHRWGDASTYAPTLNAAVQAYNILRGITFPSGEVWGGGIPAADLPFDVWVAAMDTSDALVDDGDGGAEAQFRAGLEVFADDEPFSVIEELLKGCNGALAEAGGVWSIRVGAPALPVLFVLDDDIIVDEPEDFKPFPTPDQIYNAISATYPDPSSLWEPTESKSLTNYDWEAEDGNRRLTASLSLPVVPYPVQVQRLTAALIADHRRMRRHVLTLPPMAAAVEALDTISWTSAENNYTAKLFEVSEATRDPRTQLVRVSLREVDPGDYDIPDALTLPTPPDPSPLRPAPQSVPGFAVVPHVVSDGVSDRRAGVLVAWDPEGADDARGLRIAVRPSGDTTAGTERPLQNVASGAAVFIDGLLPNEGYELRAMFDVDRPTDWTAWLPVTVPDVRLGEGDLSDDAREKFNEAFDNHYRGLEDADGVVGEFRARLEAVLGVSLVPGSPVIPGFPSPVFPGLTDQAIPRLRSLDGALTEVEMAVASLVGLIDENRRLTTDAGIMVDPETGRVRIHGLDVQSDKVASLEIDLNAALGELALRVTTAEMNQAISEAVLDPSQLPFLDDIVARLTAAEITLSSQGISLSALVLDVDDLGVRLGSAEVTLSDAVIDLEAVNTTITDQGTRLGVAEVQIGALDVPGITFAVQSTYSDLTREDMREMALADEAIRRGLGLADLELSAAAARQEISAWTEGEFEAEAAARLQLSADIAGVSAGLSVEQTARADADSAEATARQALAVTVGDNTAAISTEATARADADSAEAAARQALAVTVGDNTAAISTEQVVRADGDSALSATIASLSATVDGNTGAISTINATKVDAAGAVAAVNQVISAEYGDMLALAEATAFAEATINGVTSGYVWKLGDEDVLSLIRIEDGVSEPVTTARLKADYIRLDGDVEVDGSFYIGGSMSARFATIGTLKSAETGERVEISDDTIKVYDANNVLRVLIGDLA